MSFELRELTMEMGKPEYDMYQDIPAKESGSTNLGKGLSFEVFPQFLENEIAKKYLKISYYSVPTIIFILYLDDYPLGLVGLRPEIDENWRKWSGNMYYVIRESERGKGYGTKIVELGIEKLKEIGLKSIFVKASEGNDASARVIEKNGGRLFEKDGASKIFKIEI